MEGPNRPLDSGCAIVMEGLHKVPTSVLRSHTAISGYD
jgi:hypothetical protein